MKRAQCVEFLQWIMPRLGLHWSGFKRVHGQVCKRLGRRVADLGLPDFAAYRSYVLDHDSEWPIIDAACRITVSRFYRDATVFERLTAAVLPDLAAAALGRSVTEIRAWSAGCGAGEEPYSLILAWRFGGARRFANIGLSVVATDVDEAQLVRADAACYRAGTLRELPADWRNAAFQGSGALWCLRPEFRQGVRFLRQDIRADAPPGPFDLILCRNLAFTYFDDAQRRNVLEIVTRELAPDGVLVIGRDELLPSGAAGYTRLVAQTPLYRRSAGAMGCVA
jgi:chemotaxis protein methyltransferase CheR